MNREDQLKELHKQGLVIPMDKAGLSEVLKDMPVPKTEGEFISLLGSLLLEKPSEGHNDILQLVKLYMGMAASTYAGGCKDIPLCFESAAARLIAKVEEVAIGG